MEALKIQGPNLLKGEIVASGAKNAALPALAASLLTDEPLELERVPAVRDIRTMRSLLECLGVSSVRRESEVVLQTRSNGNPDEAPYDLVKTMRASVLVLGPLLARRGHARVSLPGGCAIGLRPVDQHLAGLEALGARVKIDHGYVEARAEKLVGAPFRFAVPTVGGTENLLMAAVLADGRTTLHNCAREPEIGDLVELLGQMGARIEGQHTDTLVIDGVDRLHGARHRIIADRIETGTYLIAGALCGGDVTVIGSEPADLAPLLVRLTEIGADVEANPGRLRVRGAPVIKPSSIVTEPHPGFPTDLQAQYMTLMTQATGVSTVSETVFENRFQHVPELARMGADIRVEGGRYARVYGSTVLSGASVMATDLRASACLVLAGLCAEGTTTVQRIYHLDRGYETMESKLQSLGARVERIQAGQI